MQKSLTKMQRLPENIRWQKVIKVGGEALSLNGTGQFLDVKKKDGESLLTGEKELTVSYDAKLEKGAKGWILYASDSNKAPSYPNERYLGILHGSTNSENEMNCRAL